MQASVVLSVKSYGVRQTETITANTRKNGGTSASVLQIPDFCVRQQAKGYSEKVQTSTALLALHNSSLRVFAASVRQKDCLKGSGCALALLALHSSSYQVTCSGAVYTCTTCTGMLETDAAWRTFPCS